MGSGAIESAIRRVINLRLKGNSISWYKENAEGMLLLRCLVLRPFGKNDSFGTLSAGNSWWEWPAETFRLGLPDFQESCHETACQRCALGTY
jgi:hypothetical protein